MSEALDLSVNAVNSSAARTPTTPSTPTQSTSLDHLESSAATGLLTFPCGTDFLQTCASTFNNLPQPLMNQAAAILPALNQTNREFFF